jgi:uncharacterized protein
MVKSKINKRKIINDPVFGFINLQSEIVFDLIEHPYFQRLRRIRQLGMSSLVFPGANHTRFEHTMGAMHLMCLAIDVLRQKGVEISNEESEGAICAILLHDIGHGPFSHALEFTLVAGLNHEMFSLMMMEKLNEEFDHRLDLAIEIFKGEYPRKFLHQLVSSQLDMDRLDYLRRDSFFSGVVEGNIGSDRIIKMLDVKNDVLVVEKKAIYSIEEYLIARRMMYWQVYLHKTVLTAEYQLINALKKAKELAMSGVDVWGSPQLQWFLTQYFRLEDLNDKQKKYELIENYVLLDDADILSSLKVWCKHPDPVLSFLSRSIINRKLYKIKISDSSFSNEKVQDYKDKAIAHFLIDAADVNYYVVTGTITNSAYESESENIQILLKNGKTQELSEASDLDLGALAKTVRKHFMCYPKELDLN